MGWLSKQWEQIRGNFKYEVLRTAVLWIFTVFGASMIATVASIGAFVTGHREMATLISIPSIFWLAQSLILYLQPKKISPRVLNLLLSTHGDNSSNVYLEVLNNGQAIKASARLNIISKSYGEGVKKYTYDGQWGLVAAPTGYWEHRPNVIRTTANIESGKSCLLRIASFDSTGYGISEMSLIGIDESLKWDFEPTPNSHLPFFTLNVKLFAEDIEQPVSKLYTVGPKTARGPLGMAEVSA